LNSSVMHPRTPSFRTPQLYPYWAWTPLGFHLHGLDHLGWPPTRLTPGGWVASGDCTPMGNLQCLLLQGLCPTVLLSLPCPPGLDIPVSTILVATMWTEIFFIIVATITSDRTVAKVVLDTTFAFVICLLACLLALLTSSQCCCLSNTFGILVYTAEYTFPILFY
jgi:hypothetical protein